MTGETPLMATSVSKIYLSSDHAGGELRCTIAAHLNDLGHAVEDLGPAADESVDYPDYGAKLAKAMHEDPDSRGVAVCGSGIGISIAVNRFPWVRAALVGDATAARLSREHNDANVLALGQRLTGVAVALDCVDIFMKTEFEGGRHARRVDKLASPGDTA
jgi:ribose 5-phosphate isomerase B